MLKKTVITVVVILIGVMGFQIVRKLQYKEALAEKIHSLPNFSFQTLEGENFTNNNLPKNNKVVFVYFNTECDYCYHETKDIEAHIADFGNVTLVFVSAESAEAINLFAKQQGLDKYENVVFVQDKNYSFVEDFGANSIPYILAYDAQGKLLLKNKGQLRAKKLIQLLDEN